MASRLLKEVERTTIRVNKIFIIFWTGSDAGGAAFLPAEDVYSHSWKEAVPPTLVKTDGARTLGTTLSIILLIPTSYAILANGSNGNPLRITIIYSTYNNAKSTYHTSGIVAFLNLG